MLDDAELARLWGARKNNKEMSFLELCNEMRPYYARGLMFKVYFQNALSQWSLLLLNTLKRKLWEPPAGITSGGKMTVSALDV